ncbi:hypothetical protein K469DRAFT_688145 [Zopfia rhizophila CBS 207.26]|uniref:Rhodopsin domain-containing protein n=1 Tax=Zopfia rhizophila CBS 207.26 TaxID=1314779 RepID=A0A6A6E5B4_9PEZI|nr:hypothetical protein K469DRAFT_688145 [Zopfia rhizophila CBS 207.26]
MDEHRELNHFIGQATAASWPFFAIATIVFGMRTISRIFFTEASACWEDLIISISWVLDVVRMVTFQLALSATSRVDPSNFPQTVPSATFWGLFTCSWAFLSVTLPKVGVAFLLVRIFRPRPWIRATITSMAIGLFVVCIGGFIVCFVQCNPVAGQWDPYKHPETKCWPRNVQMNYSLVGSSTSAFLDLVFAIYPGFIISRLQLPLWKKLSTIGFMGLGVAAFAFAVVKVYSNTTLLGNPTLNELYTKALHIGLWNSIENDFVLIAACLPSVRPVFKACGVFSRTHFTASKRTRMNSTSDSQHSLKASSGHEPLDEHVIELALNRQPPRSMNQSIRVKYDVSLQRERTEPDGPTLPSYNFEIR